LFSLQSFILIMLFLAIAATTLISTAIAVQGAPLPLEQRNTVNFHILTAGAEACAPAQVAILKTAINDAKELAAVARKVLAVKNMSKSTAFLRFMGASRLVGRPANRGNHPSLIGGSSEASPADVSKRFELVSGTLPFTDPIQVPFVG
jgi:hypothetical protein